MPLFSLCRANANGVLGNKTNIINHLWYLTADKKVLILLKSVSRAHGSHQTCTNVCKNHPEDLKTLMDLTSNNFIISESKRN